MGDIVEVLGSKKFFGATNETLKSRIILEQLAMVRNEYNLFTNISQDDQFVKEKNENLKYKVYGTISPILSKEVSFRGVKINVDKNILAFNKNNWSVVLAIPVKFNSAKGKKEYAIKYTSAKDNASKIFNIDFSKGLPASIMHPNPKMSNKKASFLLHFEHNFLVGDTVYIKSEDTLKLASGAYNIVNVDGNKITIDYPMSSIRFYETALSEKQSPADINKTATLMGIETTKPPNTYTGVIRNVQTTDNSILLSALKNPRPAPYDLIEPKFFLSKVVDNEVLEYYVKQIKIVKIADDLDQCGFSNNLFNNELINYYFTDDLDINGLYDNKNEPMTECYLGVIKNGPTKTNVFEAVESNFNYLIDYTNTGEGIKTVAERSTSDVSDKPDLNNVLDYGICEYSSELLTETLISPVMHNFFHNNIIFKYQPFYEIKLRLKSTYVEDSTSNRFIPTYAVYSRKNDKFIWRDILDLGFSDDEGNLLDFPFLNGSRYAYQRLNFHVLSEKNKTKKYALNVNDITNIDSVNVTVDYIRNVTDDLFGDNNDDTNNDSFQTYTDKKC
jgi:hypothetical protein